MQGKPQKISRYEIVRLLGEGAMGRVYLASDPNIGRQLAIKTVRSELQMSDTKKKEFLERFAREARAAGRLAHPNIVAVYDAGEDDGVPWIAMEYVEGKSLKELRQKELIPLASNVLWIAEKVAAALDAAHHSGTIHRDIKPANILISDDGDVKVTDFGVAHLEDSELTREGVLLGSPSYMSPEQVRGIKLSNSSDFFSLAVILYEWMTGVKPFSGKDLPSLTHKIVYEAATPPSTLDPKYGPEIDRFFSRALAKKSDERFRDGREFYQQLQSCFEASTSRTTFQGSRQEKHGTSPNEENQADSTQMRQRYINEERSETGEPTVDVEQTIVQNRGVQRKDEAFYGADQHPHAPGRVAGVINRKGSSGSHSHSTELSRKSGNGQTLVAVAMVGGVILIVLVLYWIL